MANESHDILIIGGGITGATIARDAAKRGLKVALVEKKDFSHGTSSASSKLVHGGLRYLKNMEFGLIRESLMERRTWERIAPHLVYPLPFLVPTFDSGEMRKLNMGIGLTLYDLLSFDRKWLKDPDQRLPRHRSLSRHEILKLAPSVDRTAVTGAMLYYDCQMYSPERLGLECLLEAANLGAHVANYAEVTSLLKVGHAIEGAHVRDVMSGDEHDIRAAITINAGGPWADIVLRLASEGDPSKLIVRSKGIHIIVPALTEKEALTVQVDGNHFFVLPWRGYSLIGTTDTLFEKSPDNVCVTEDDISSLLAKVNKGLPGANLNRDDVIHAYAGLRPLIDSDNDPNNNENTYGFSRAAEVIDHWADDRIEGFVSALGGKWTTSRHVAETATDLIFKKLNRKTPKCQTAHAPTWGGDIGNFRAYVRELCATYTDLEQELIENLARYYGSKATVVIDLALAEDLSTRVSTKLPDIAAEIVYAVRYEAAQTLEDVLFRRTGIGTLGHPGDETIDICAGLMAAELGWTPEERDKQIATAEEKYTVEAGE